VFAKYVLPAMKCEAASSFLFITGGAGACLFGGWHDCHPDRLPSFLPAWLMAAH
jgi:hypothetical protein